VSVTSNELAAAQVDQERRSDMAGYYRANKAIEQLSAELLPDVLTIIEAVDRIVAARDRVAEADTTTARFLAGHTVGQSAHAAMMLAGQLRASFPGAAGEAPWWAR
jgi:hypothetical protein